MATAAPTVSSTKETTNYARLCRLLVDVGTQALRDTFDAIHPPLNLHSVLRANKTTLQSLRARKIINATQWGKLFPAILTSVSSAHFDITLLMVLLRNVCGLLTPTAGWDTLPAATDVSREADIARVKFFRNTVYSHAECASVDDATFDVYWGDIRDTLVRLGGAKYKAAIGNLETECMDPEVEDHSKELLSQWKKDEDNVKDKLDELIKKVDDLKSSSLPQRKETAIEGKFTVLKELSEDSAMCREKGHENEPLDRYCLNCKVCICGKCGQTRHTHHTKVSIQQAAEEEKLKMEETVKQVKMQIVDLETQMKTTTELFIITMEKITETREDVSTTVKELIRVINEHERTMLTELDFLEKAQQRDHLTQLEHLQASINELKSSVQDCEEILEKNVSFETLHEQKAEIERSKGVLKAVILDFYWPYHLRYQKDEKLIKNLTSEALGKVLVSKTDPLKTLLQWNGSMIVNAGQSKSFNVVTFDSNGEQCYQEIDEIKVNVQSPTGMDLDLEYHQCFRGRYNFNYTPLCVGEHGVTVLVNSQPLPGSPWSLSVRPYLYLRSIDIQFTELARFKVPCAVAIDKYSGNIAIADREEQGVKFFDSFWNCLAELGKKGTVAEKLKDPSSVTFTQSGDVIVIASGTMFCFDVGGKFTGCINNKQIKVPFTLTVTHDGRMIVCDTGDKSVKVLSPDGTKMLQSFSAPNCDDSPWEAVYHQDMFFVSYPTARCVKKFDKDGFFLHDIGNKNSENGQLRKPRGLAVDVFGTLAVCDEENKSLNLFQPDGTFMYFLQNSKFDCPWSIAFNSSSKEPFFIVADLNQKNVMVCR